MCERCEKFKELSERADSVREDALTEESMFDVSADLEEHFRNIAVEDGIPLDDPEIVAYNEGIRGWIIEGNRPAGVQFSSPPKDVEDMMRKMFGQPEEPKIPSLEDFLEEANMGVEQSLIRVEPIIRLVKELREKLEEAGFSPAVAEQMAATVFVGTFSGRS